MSEFERLPAATVLRIHDRCKALDLDVVGFAWAIEVEAERAIVAQLMALLPGPYYMDPPDGGSVTLLEQLQRMAKDAELGRRTREHAEAAIACELRCEG